MPFVADQWLTEANFVIHSQTIEYNIIGHIPSLKINRLSEFFNPLEQLPKFYGSQKAVCENVPEKAGFIIIIIFFPSFLRNVTLISYFDTGRQP